MKPPDAASELVWADWDVLSDMMKNFAGISWYGSANESNCSFARGPESDVFEYDIVCSMLQLARKPWRVSCVRSVLTRSSKDRPLPDNEQVLEIYKWRPA